MYLGTDVKYREIELRYMIKEMHFLSLLLECHTEIAICPLEFAIQLLGPCKNNFFKRAVSEINYHSFIKNAYARMPKHAIKTSLE